MKTLLYKIASAPGELEQIHRLNYETFVEEIPQHPANPEKRLVDQFHDQNTYVICKKGEDLVGMIAARALRPFSLDAKLANLDSYLPPDRVMCEIRLLAVKPAYRRQKVFFGLLQRTLKYCLEMKYDLALISGTTLQTKLYQHLGFQPFGPPVGSEQAPYQPMFLRLEDFRKAVPKLFSN